MWNPEMKAESGSTTLNATCWEMLAGLLTLAPTAVRAYRNRMSELMDSCRTVG
jgi:hypothetical protein